MNAQDGNKTGVIWAPSDDIVQKNTMKFEMYLFKGMRSRIGWRIPTESTQSWLQWQKIKNFKI